MASIAATAAVNVVDYAVGGVRAASLGEAVFWIGFVAALPAGLVAACPLSG